MSWQSKTYKSKEYHMKRKWVDGKDLKEASPLSKPVSPKSICSIVTSVCILWNSIVPKFARLQEGPGLFVLTSNRKKKNEDRGKSYIWYNSRMNKWSFNLLRKRVIELYFYYSWEKGSHKNNSVVGSSYLEYKKTYLYFFYRL